MTRAAAAGFRVLVRRDLEEWGVYAYEQIGLRILISQKGGFR
jgi:hypothetical protein